MPALAYFHILSHVKREPLNSPLEQEVETIMAANWNTRAARKASLEQQTGEEDKDLTFPEFMQSVMKGFNAFAVTLKNMGQSFADEPHKRTGKLRTDVGLQELNNASAGSDEFSVFAQSGDLGGQFTVTHGSSDDPDMNWQAGMGGEMAHFWTAMDWRFLDTQGW